MGAVGIIPARVGSTRFPGKVLADRTGWPLVRHVWDSARRAARLDDVVIATDDPRVADAAASFGARAIMTSPDHANGTSRLAEAAGTLELAPDAVVVNVQGDEPELDPALIDAAVAALGRGLADMATVAVPFGPGDDPADPNLVKVVRRPDGTALYFSRSRIPYPRDAARAPACLKHVGLYAYTRAFLDRYAALPPTPLEQAESLEQLRALEHGHAIAVAVVDVRTHGGIDTPEQYDAFVRRWLARAAGRGA